MIRNKVVAGWGQGTEIRKRDWGSEIMGKESKISERMQGLEKWYR